MSICDSPAEETYRAGNAEIQAVARRPSPSAAGLSGGASGWGVSVPRGIGSVGRTISAPRRLSGLCSASLAVYLPSRARLGGHVEKTVGLVLTQPPHVLGDVSTECQLAARKIRIRLGSRRSRAVCRLIQHSDARFARYGKAHDRRAPNHHSR